jgi:multidrug efflux pump subunit AcrB
MVTSPDAFAKIPLYSDGRKTVFLGDVADIEDGTRWRTNTVLADGRPAVYVPLLRQAGASAVRVVDSVQAFLPKLYERGVVPADVHVELAFDQSQYVRDALNNLKLESLSGAILASLVVLLFLGSLRSTWIVALSIPLSVLTAFVGLYFSGETLNIMTLGGLALVIGRIVDDSIVDVENTIRHIGMGKSPLRAAIDSAEEIAVPVLMATVTTVIVFVPITFMTGMGKYLFTPLALSATFAMFASYLVSRTVSPLYCARHLRPHNEKERFPRWMLVLGLLAGVLGLAAYLVFNWVPLPLDHLSVRQRQIVMGAFQGLLIAGMAGGGVLGLGLLFWISPAFDFVFEKFSAVYERLLRACLSLRFVVILLLVAAVVPTWFIAQEIGQELFPEVDTSEFTIHIRAAGGPRVEETERQVREIEQMVRDVVPKEDVDTILANVGLSSRWSAIYTSNNGPHAAFLRVQLRSGFAGRRTPTRDYVEEIRSRLKDRFPTHDFFFESGGMIRQILNAGASAPIEVQVYGRDNVQRRRVARELDRMISDLPKVQDTYLPQAMDLPQLRIDVDRTAAIRSGLTETDVIRNVITTLMSSAQIAPNIWIDPERNNPYLIGVQYAEHNVDSIQTLEKIPLTGGKDRSRVVCRLEDVARIERILGPVEVYHKDVNRVSQLFVSVAGNDLAGIAAEVEKKAKELPLSYALDHLPHDKLYLRDDADFLWRLKEYLKKRDPGLRKDIKGLHGGLDVATLTFPADTRIEVRGEVSNMRQSFQDMAFILGLAVLLLYLLMAAQFSSWLDPMVMIVAAPLGLFGVILTLWLTGTSLNIQSLMGILMMIGIAHSNSTLIVDFANRKRTQGQDTRSAIVEASRTRLRPILMTSIATIVGLLPLALHLQPGDEMNLPLARAVIGGLAVSTVLTLFVVPVLYTLLKPRHAANPESVP